MKTELTMFCDELDALILRWRKESNQLLLGDVIAALEMKKHTLLHETVNRQGEFKDEA